MLICLVAADPGTAADHAALALEHTILLGDVRGRIDHLAVDLRRQHLFVAELGNGSIAAVDLKSGSVWRRVTGLREPQGALFVPATAELHVASGGDGTVRVYRGDDLAAAGIIPLRDDADNLRLDPQGHQIIAGHSDGALALLDATTHRLVADIALGAHPEGFQISRDGQRAYVNIPARREIAVVDLSRRQRVASWPMTGAAANFPMAIEPRDSSVWVASREPPRLVRFTPDGATALTLDTCGDSDDLFFDELRHRLYVICGSGQVDVLEQRGSQYTRIARIATVPGARTGLFVPELDTLFVAARATGQHPAAILVFRPDKPPP